MPKVLLFHSLINTSSVCVCDCNIRPQPHTQFAYTDQLDFQPINTLSHLISAYVVSSGGPRGIHIKAHICFCASWDAQPSEMCDCSGCTQKSPPPAPTIHICGGKMITDVNNPMSKREVLYSDSTACGR